MSESRQLITRNINPAAVGAPFQVELERIKWRVAFGLNRADQATAEDLILPETPVQVSAANNLEPTLDEIKENFRSWVILNGLRDCAEAFHAYLDFIHRCCLLWKLAGPAPIPAESLPDLLETPCAQFHNFKFPKKLAYLRDNFGIQFNEAGLRCVKSLNKARNCMSHRGGIVGREDCTNGTDEFHLEWRIIGLTTNEGQEVAFGQRIGPNTGIFLSFPAKQRIYQLGQKLDFSTRDFVEFIMTYLLLSMDASPQLIAYAKSVCTGQADEKVGDDRGQPQVEIQGTEN